MKISELEKKLLEVFIENDSPVAVVIKGDWGTGKTYFWRNIFLDKHKDKLKDKNVYISLFGHSSLNDIKADIIFQISRFTKYASGIKKLLKGLGSLVFKGSGISISLTGGTLSAILSLLTLDDFKNAIICFDDFERLSSSIEIKDLMGFISNLKEQKNCKILMILNEEELKKLHEIQETKKELDTFSLYKEKIVDYEFLFENDIKDFIENYIGSASNNENKKNIIKSEDIKSIVLNYFSDYGINNLRLIKQLIETANSFYENIMDNNIKEEVKKSFIYLLFSILYLRRKYNITSKEYYELKEKKRRIRFESLEEQPKNTNDDSSSNDNKENATKAEKMKYLMDFVYANDDIEDLIWQHIENEKDIRDELEEILKKLSSESQINQDRETLENNWRKVCFDFSYSIEDFIKDTKPILERDNVHDILGLDYYYSFLRFIKKYGNFNKIKETETIKKYIDKIVNREKSASIHEWHNIDSFVEENYPELSDYLNNKRREILIQNISCEELKELLEKVISGWGEKDQYILNNTSKNRYRECMLKSPDFVKTIINFLRAKARDDIYFKQTVTNVVEVLKELKEEKESYKFKVKEIFKEAGLTHLNSNKSVSA